jgi:hypothetical protein
MSCELWFCFARISAFTLLLIFLFSTKMDDGLKIRRSTRDIKRPKFDDEIFGVPGIQPKPVVKKRERNFQSPDYSDLALVFELSFLFNIKQFKDEPSPALIKMAGGKKKPGRQSLDKNTSQEKIVYRERIDSQASVVSFS